MFDVRRVADVVHDELEQLTQSGYRISDELRAAATSALDQGDTATLEKVLQRLTTEPTRAPDWPFTEPEELDAVLAATTGFNEPPSGDQPNEDALRDRIHGAWLGRCAGCCTGKPVEGLGTPTQIRGYLKAVDAWPLDGYVPVDATLLPAGEITDMSQFHVSWPESSRGRIHGAPRDDDTDYTILGLHVLEQYGADRFTTANVASNWLDKLPYLQTYTAERAAYRNLVAGGDGGGGGVPIDTQKTATHRNPWREWIGALIRADIFGYVHPGQPERAARGAFVDASLSHRANGIYGAMWAAALVAEAFTSQTAAEAVTKSSRWIPKATRLAASFDGVVEIHSEGGTWEDAIAWIDHKFSGHSWVHTLNNAAVIVAALLWCHDDPMRAIGLAVQAGYDTDSAAATVGSVVGAVYGVDRLPKHMTEPLQDTLRSAVQGFDDSRISELATRTLKLVQKRDTKK